MMTRLMQESLDRLVTTMTVGGRFNRRPPTVRVRRRGFPRGVKRGDEVWWNGTAYHVLRRSAWTLWLQEAFEPPVVGDAIRIRRPRRFAGDGADESAL